MLDKLAVWITMMCLIAPTASADYTGELQCVFADDVIFDCGNWSTVENSGGSDTVKSHYYSWSSKDGIKRREMFSHAYHNLPVDIDFVTGKGYVTWVYAYNMGFMHQIIDANGIIYTNDTQSVSVRCGYLETPCDSWGCMNNNLDSVTQSTTIADNLDGGIDISTIFRIDQHRTSNSGKKQYVTHYKAVSQTVDAVRTWQPVNTNITVSISNYTDRCTVLHVETPKNITGIRIDVVSPNTTAFYEKHAYYMERNVTDSGHQFFYLKPHVFESRSNMTPVGVNVYSLPKDDYNISVTLYTPFEVINASVSVVESDPYGVEPPKTPFKQILHVLVIMAGIMFIGRSI